MDIILCLSLGRIYPWNMCLNIISFPLFCLIWWSYFLPLVCLNLFYDLYDISSNNPLLVQTPRCTTLSVRPCYYCCWHSGNHRWTGTLPIGPPRFNEQENGSLRPSPLVPMLLPTWPSDSPLTCLAYMIVQDVTNISTFNHMVGP